MDREEYEARESARELASRKCQTCGTENDEGWFFCKKCGARNMETYG